MTDEFLDCLKSVILGVNECKGRSMRNIKLTIEYDGTRYHGWQRQENAVTVQEVVEKAIHKLTGEEVNVTGCSRTDEGVHALGHVSNFRTQSSIPADRFAYALNTWLPEDVAVVRSEEADEAFHARFDSKGKKYRYIVHNAPCRSALLRSRAWHVMHVLDVAAMQKAAEALVGTHDFTAFMATGSNAKTTVRTMYSAKVEQQGNTVYFEVQGDGFLYNMVRIMAGTLVYVGLGKISAGEVPEIITGKDRKKAGMTAPAPGLYLVEVFY